MPFELERFRLRLREVRERAGGRDKIAEKIGINRTTIQNAEVGPDIPGIDTVARIVEGSGLTLPDFFALCDAATAPTRDETIKIGLPSPADLAHDLPVSGESTRPGARADVDQVPHDALADQLAGILVEFVQRGMAARHQSATDARRKTPSRRRPVRKRRRPRS